MQWLDNGQDEIIMLLSNVNKNNNLKQLNNLNKMMCSVEEEEEDLDKS